MLGLLCLHDLLLLFVKTHQRNLQEWWAYAYGTGAAGVVQDAGKGTLWVPTCRCAVAAVAGSTGCTSFCRTRSAMMASTSSDSLPLHSVSLCCWPSAAAALPPPFCVAAGHAACSSSRHARYATSTASHCRAFTGKRLKQGCSNAPRNTPP